MGKIRQAIFANCLDSMFLSSESPYRHFLVFFLVALFSYDQTASGYLAFIATAQLISVE